MVYTRNYFVIVTATMFLVLVPAAPLSSTNAEHFTGDVPDPILEKRYIFTPLRLKMKGFRISCGSRVARPQWWVCARSESAKRQFGWLGFNPN